MDNLSEHWLLYVTISEPQMGAKTAGQNSGQKGLSRPPSHPPSTAATAPSLLNRQGKNLRKFSWNTAIFFLFIYLFLCYDWTHLDERLTVEIKNGDTDRDLVICEKTNIHYSTVSTVLQFLAQWHISIGGSPVCTVIPGTGWEVWYNWLRT